MQLKFEISDDNIATITSTSGACAIDISSPKHPKIISHSPEFFSPKDEKKNNVQDSKPILGPSQTVL